MADQPLVNLVATFGVAGLDALKAEIASANATVANLGTLAQAAGRQLSGMAGTGAVLAGVAQSGADLGGELAGAASAGQTLAAVNLSAVKGNVVTLTDAAQGLNQALGQSGQGAENIEAVGEAAEKAAEQVQELGQAQAGAQKPGPPPLSSAPGQNAEQARGAAEQAVKVKEAWSGAFNKAGGTENQKTELANIDQKVSQLSLKLPTLGNAFRQAFKTVTDPRTWQTITTGLSSLGGALQWPVMGLYGLAAAGFYASSSGQVFGYQMQELSRQVGSVFAPVIKGIIDKMSSLIHWFQGLSGEQQKSIRFWGLLGGSIVATSLVVPRIIGTFKLATVAVQTFGAAIKSLSLAAMANPWLLAVGAIALVGVGIASLVASTGEWREIVKDLSSTFNDLKAVAKDVFGEMLKGIREVMGEVKKFGAAMDEAAGIKGKGGGLGGRDFSFERGFFNPIGGMRDISANVQSNPQLESLRKTLEGMTKWSSFNPGKHLASLFLKMGKEDKTPREELGPPLRGFESIDAAYKRISEAGIKATAAGGFKSPQEEAVDQLKLIYATIEQLKIAAGNIKPAVV